ncbi:hypothetical protein UFOVP1244_4 [uncultured Caudovirales phage]|uniref:Uncharacterized protein n=1 Tax=uncultured Caudovirales phage TaxID=2100421 RepID=A0A6J5RIL2_9CAUD|nr:hypothetical protein UFOVP1244_4 [uncultured Caudovirales phage]
MPRKHVLEPFEVWCSGWESSDGRGAARFLGKFNAESFADACEMAIIDRSLFDRERLTYWGCGLFDNETDARRSFG